MIGTVKEIRGTEAGASLQFGRPRKVFLKAIYDKQMQIPDGFAPCPDNSKCKGPKRQPGLTPQPQLRQDRSSRPARATKRAQVQLEQLSDSVSDDRNTSAKKEAGGAARWLRAQLTWERPWT